MSKVRKVLERNTRIKLVASDWQSDILSLYEFRILIYLANFIEEVERPNHKFKYLRASCQNRTDLISTWKEDAIPLGE